MEIALCLLREDVTFYRVVSTIYLDDCLPSMQIHIMADIKRELSSYNDTLALTCQSRDPTEFSFWLMANLPLDDQLKLHLLSLNNAVQRLRCEQAILHAVSLRSAKLCGEVIDNMPEVL